MVSALVRKEDRVPTTINLGQHDIYFRKDANNRQEITKKLREKSIKRENFPYALREFINSHLDLPRLEEIGFVPNKPLAF